LDAARAQFDLNDLQAARATVQAALSADPSWREAQQLLVTIDARDGQVDRAFERAKGLLTDPSPVSLALLKGDLQAMAGKTAEAIGSYESAQRLQPSAPVAVRLYQLRRQIGESSPERSLTQWLERTPGDLEVRRMLALYYEAAGQGERAIGEYERLAGAGDVVALNNLAWALHSKGDPRALDLARKAHESAPKHPEIADTYGWILVRMGKVSEGLAVLQSALVNAPNNPDILYHVAAAYRQSGDADRAAQLVKQALEPKRDFVSRAEAEQLARELADRKGAR
jgi:tetratricopeptide (TPR) repeat protein